MKKNDALKEIIAKKKEKLILAKQNLPESELKAKISGAGPTLPFIQAINKPRVISLIAEIKKASPSAGILRQDFDPAAIAAIYQESGAAAISVLTEEDFFIGDINYIKQIKSLVKLPVLRKDFIFEAYQVYESRFYGADALLLIAELLSKDKLAELIQIAQDLGMDCLVEAHNEKDLKKALSLKAPLIGINNRDLHSLEVDFKTTENLFTLIPKDKIVVVESGVKSFQDILFLKVLGVNAVLIGQAFMQSPDIAKKIEEVMGW